MTPKAATARAEADLFLDPSTERPTRRKRARGGLVDGVVNGERVLIHANKEPLEKQIEIRIRVVLATAGVIVWKHTVLTCHVCGMKPRKQSGLGRACADLICVVPPMGRFLAIEVKRPKTRNAKRDEHQRRWAKIVRAHGGIAGTATNEAEALALLAEARRPYQMLASSMRVIQGGQP